MRKAIRNTGKEWSVSDVKQLYVLARENTSVRVIGLKLGRTEDAVRSKASDRGISLRQGTLLLAFLIVTLTVTPIAHAAVLFDGVDDILSFDTMGDVVFTENSALTISLWFNATSLGEGDTGVFVRRGTDRLLRVATTDAIQFNIAGATLLTRKSVNSVFTLNSWNHVCLTWDGSTTAANSHIYVNGTEVGYATTTDLVTPTDNASETLTIGNNIATSASFDGQMCEVAIYSAVLTAADIVKLAQSRTGQMPLMCSVAPVAYWPLHDFSEGATVTGAGAVLDWSGNGYHGTAANSPVARAGVVVTGP